MRYKKGLGNGFILSLILLVLISSFSACSKSKQHMDEEIHRIPVIIKPVKRGSLESVTEYTGIVKPKKMVYVVSAAPGRVTEYTLR